MFARLRQLAAPAIGHGFDEKSSGMAPVTDPADAKRTLDTFFEIVVAKEEPDLEAMLALVRFALTIAQTAESRH